MGIYIHIPFCKKKCHYCDFHFSTSLKFKDDVLLAMHKELLLQKNYLKDLSIETIYFGGGTPSYLSVQEIKTFIDLIFSEFQVAKTVEITLEANPDDLSKEKLVELKESGINRLSIGIQSFYDEHLQWMNRAHAAKEAIESVQNAQEIGFDNITIDLIYGLPQMTMKEWKVNVQKAIDLNVQHISAYNLTVEEGTALDHFVKTGKSKPVSDEMGAEQFQYLMRELKINGFIHYEISNFGKEGFLSLHNTSYWLGKKYLGIGPSAHSFNGASRQWNIANNGKYIRALQSGSSFFEREELTLTNQFNEYILIGLRTIWGCDLIYIMDNFGKDLAEKVQYKIEDQKDFFTFNETTFKLTQEGMLYADGIAASLFED